MEIEKKTEVWIYLSEKETKDIKAHYINLSNDDRANLPPILNDWFCEVCNLPKGERL